MCLGCISVCPASLLRQSGQMDFWELDIHSEGAVYSVFAIYNNLNVKCDSLGKCKCYEQFVRFF